MNTYVRTVLITALMTTSLQQTANAAEAFFGALATAVPTVYSYFTSRPVRADGTTASTTVAEGPEALDAYLTQDDFAALTTKLKTMLKKKGDLAGKSLVWLEANWQAMPPLQYILLRHTAHRAQNGDTLKPEEVNRALEATFYFLVNCHIDTLLCMKAVQQINQFCITSEEADAVRACRWQVLSATDLQDYLLTMQQDFNNKYPGIAMRVAQKYTILTAKTSSLSTADSLLYETILGQATAPLTKNMHAAAWAIAVWRDDSYDYKALETARTFLGSWAPGNEPGGLIFDGFTTDLHKQKTNTAHIALRHIKSDTLKRWYNKLYASLMQHLTETASTDTSPINSWDAFLNSPALRIWFNNEANHIIYPTGRDDASTSRRNSASLADDMAVTVIDDDEDDDKELPTTIHSEEESNVLSAPAASLPATRESQKKVDAAGALSGDTIPSDTALATVTARLSNVLVSSPQGVASKPEREPYDEAEQLDDDKSVISKSTRQHQIAIAKPALNKSSSASDESDGTVGDLETTEDGDGGTDWF